MRTIRMTFEVVKVHATRRGQCSVCGRHCTRSYTAEGTINPFNKNEDGSVKTREEVREALKPKVEAWKQTPLRHVRCEP